MPRQSNTSRICLVLTIGAALAGCMSDSPDEKGYGIAQSELANFTIYSNGKIATGWKDISNTSHTVNSGTILHNGLRTLSAKFSARGWVSFENAVGQSGNDALSFYIHGGTNVSAVLSAEIKYENTWSMYIEQYATSIGQYCDGGVIPKNAWTYCQIPLSVFGATSSTFVQGVSFDGTGTALKTVTFSTIKLISTAPQGVGGATSTGGSTANGGSSPLGGSSTSGGNVSNGGSTTSTSTVAGGTTSVGGSSSSESTTIGGSNAFGGDTSFGGSTTVSGNGGSLAIGGSTSMGGTTAAMYTVYTNGVLSQGWTDTSQGTHSLNSTDVLFNGLHTISTDLSSYNWISFESNGVTGNDTLSFHVFGGSNTTPKISSEIKYGGVWSSLNGISVPSIDVYCDGGTIPTNAWTHCQIPLSVFGAASSTVLQGISFDGTGPSLNTMAFATIQLIASTIPQGTGGTTGAGGATGVGGTTSTGGTSSAGGTTSTGGTTSVGGSVSTGGTTGSGGATSTSTNIPVTGAHAIRAVSIFSPVTFVASPAITTQSTNSTFVVSTGRGDASGLGLLPTDNMGNSPYFQIGAGNRYVGYPNSGASLFTYTNGIGGVGHIFQVEQAFGDESTIAVVEVKNGHVVQDSKGAYIGLTEGNTIISPSVTTTGPATIVAFCWGDYPYETISTGVNNQFQILDQYTAPDAASVQSVSASRDVTEAGTYNVTWTIAQPITGAIVYIVAIQ